MSDDPTNEPIPGWPDAPPAGGAGEPARWTPPGSVPPPPAGPPPGAGPQPTSYGAPAHGGPPSGPSGVPAGPPPPGYPPAPGYPAPGYPAPGYGYPYQGYGGYPMAREHPQGTTVLVLGICAWVLCGLCAPFAWVMGSNALKEIDANPAAYSNRSAVQAGRILGMVYSLLVLAGIAVLAVLVVIGVLAGSTSTSG